MKNTNSVENVTILRPARFRWILFSGLREVEIVSANKIPGRPSCYSDRPEKHKLGRRHWDFASCQVSLNSVQRFQRRSRKFLSQSEARMAIFFPIGPQNTNLVEDVEILLLVKFCWILISGLREDVDIFSEPIRYQGGYLAFPISPKSTNLVEDVEILLPVKFRWITFSGSSTEVENVSANQRPVRPSCFSDRSENTNLVEDVEILLPAKVRWIPFSGFRKVENVSAKQRPGWPSCFTDWPEKTQTL